MRLFKGEFYDLLFYSGWKFYLKLLNRNCLDELDQAPYCYKPLTVVEGKKLRLVLDLRHAKKFIKQNKRCYGN